MSSKFVRDRNGEIVGMIDDPIGDAEDWERSSSKNSGYDAAAEDQYWREKHPVKYWGFKLWTWLCVVAGIITFVVLWKNQMYSDAFLGLLSVGVVYILPVLIVHVFPVVIALNLAVWGMLLEAICYPFNVIIELVKSISNSKKK